MANATANRLGQVQNAGAVDALFLKVFAGEVLEAFDTTVQTLDKHRVRDIASGKSASFPAIYKATTEYHAVGTEITGSNIPHNEIVVEVDDKLISHVFVGDVDEMKNHYNVRGPYAAELGHAVALAFDRNVSRTVLRSARGPALFTGDQGGSALTNANYGTDANVLIQGINDAKMTMDEKDVPVDTMAVYAMLKPAQWYLIANSDKNVNRDTGESSINRQILRTISDVQIIKSNAVRYGVDESGDTSVLAKYRVNQATTMGLVWTEAAAATVRLLNLQLEQGYDLRRQGDLMIAKLVVGSDPLRTKCAVELKTA